MNKPHHSQPLSGVPLLHPDQLTSEPDVSLKEKVQTAATTFLLGRWWGAASSDRKRGLGAPSQGASPDPSLTPDQQEANQLGSPLLFPAVKYMLLDY